MKYSIGNKYYDPLDNDVITIVDFKDKQFCYKPTKPIHNYYPDSFLFRFSLNSLREQNLIKLNKIAELLYL
jgi:hypothetical protein